MKLIVFASTLAVTLGIALGAAWATEPSQEPGTTKFVFTGKVKALRASTEPSVKGSDNTVVVTVEEVHPPAPDVLGETKGQDVTVKTTKSLTDAPLTVGQLAVFTTQGLVYGSGLVVREVADRKPVVGPAGAAPAPLGLASVPVTEVVGTVEEVHPVSHERVMAALGAAAPTKVFPREHDPRWHEAVVQVQSAEGVAKGQTHVVVVFPQSDDIAWRRAPKFHKGQKGKFRLHKGQIKNAALNKSLLGTRGAENPEDAASYTALNPGDFTPLP